MRQPALQFNWEAPTQKSDGTPLTADEINQLTYRLYEDDVPVVDNIGELTFSLLMTDRPQKDYKYNVTTMLYGLESVKTPDVVINFNAPAAPGNFNATWFDAEDVA